MLRPRADLDGRGTHRASGRTSDQRGRGSDDPRLT
jgi:hypothetical protein